MGNVLGGAGCGTTSSAWPTALELVPPPVAEMTDRDTMRTDIRGEEGCGARHLIIFRIMCFFPCSKVNYSGVSCLFFPQQEGNK